MQGKLKTYHFFALIAAPKIHTDLLWDLTLLFAGLCILYFGAIFFFRRKLSLGSKKVRDRKNEMSPMISEFLFYDENGLKEEKTNYVNLKIEIRELLNNAKNRKILIDILMDLRKDLSGSALDKLFELFKSLGLQHDSYEKLESWRWQSISKGILELTQMQVEESFGFISKFINNRNSTIRKQAEIAIVTLKHEGINCFLDTTTYKISEWQQLKILEVLKDKSDFQPPSFKFWLISKNKYVVLFAVRLMMYYNQSDGNQSLIELLKHKNGEIKTAAINCIKEFHVVDSLETLKLVFWDSSVDIKINILDAISTLGTWADLEFLNTIGVKDSNFNVKSKALATINAIAPSTVMPTKGIQNVDKFKVPKDIPNEVPQDIEISSETNEELANTIEVETIESQKETKTGEVNQTIQSIENSEIEEVLPIKPKNEIIESEKETNTNEFEPAAQDSEQLEIEEPSLVNKAIDPEFEDSFKMNFLPIVTEKFEKVSVERYHPKKDLFDEVQDISEIKVIFSEVLFGSTNEIEKPELPTINDSKKVIDSFVESPSIDFLPIVVSSDKEADIREESSDKKLNLLDISVIYSEIHIKTNIPKKNKILSELNALVPLPKPSMIKVKNKEKEKVDSELEKSSSNNNIDMKKIKEIECEGVEIKMEKQNTIEEKEPKIESVVQIESAEKIEQDKQNALDWIMALNDSQSELKKKIKSIVSRQEASALKLPKPLYYTDYEANMVALLDDIEVLGDQREVSLLQDLSLHKKNSFVHERILFLIEKLSDTELLSQELPELPNPSQEIGLSVFLEFFRTADTESKLILLDEIVAIGDEKEIGFLEELVKSAVPEVKKKAKVCLEGLKAKLAQEEKHSVKQTSTDYVESDQLAAIIKNETIKPFDVFDIDFELAPSENQKPKHKTR